MRVPTDSLLETAFRVLRVAAAVFMLGFMAGDLVFPQYFCEEYIIYPSAGGMPISAVPPEPLDTSVTESSSGEQIAASRLGPAEPGAGDYCLHIVHRPVYRAAVAESTWLPADSSRALLPPSVDLSPPYHPPRSL